MIFPVCKLKFLSFSKVKLICTSVSFINNEYKQEKSILIFNRMNPDRYR